MKKLRDFKTLTRDQLVKINGGTPNNPGECGNHIGLSLTMPEPGRYCLYGSE